MNASTGNSFDNLWVEVTEEQAEKLTGGNESALNPADKFFEELPGNGHIRGKGKRNWTQVKSSGGSF